MSVSTENKFNLLAKGKTVENKFLVSQASRGKFLFSKNQDDFPQWVPSLNPGSRFTVEDVSFLPGSRWVKLAPANTSGMTLKITAEEFAMNFILI